MVECIFTIDYEIYGNGQGCPLKLMYEPAQKLKTVLLAHSSRCVFFVEVAGLRALERAEPALTIKMLTDQIRDLHQNGFEIGLHIHPQWVNGRFENGSWLLDPNEYNLCALPQKRMLCIVDESIDYLAAILKQPGLVPFSFRSSNWLFQPTQPLAGVLASKGIKVDSSVFKGGYQHKIRLDYKKALKNGYFWLFDHDVTIPDSAGKILEIPIHTKMVFPWNMVGRKRIQLQQKAGAGYSLMKKLDRLRDFVRIRQPLKLDFCRMSVKAFTGMFDAILETDRKDPHSIKPVVAIGHTKDLVDFDAIEDMLTYLTDRGIPVSTFEQIYHKCLQNDKEESCDTH